MLLPFGIVALLVSAVHLAGGLDFLERHLMDLRFRLLSRPATADVVVVAVDPSSLGALDVWPWPRGYHATVLERLLEAGAARVAFDIDFSSRTEEEEDREFEAALASARKRVVLPVFRQREHDPGQPVESLRLTAPLPEFQRHAALATINIRPDPDGLIRRYWLREDLRAPSFPTFAAALSGPSPNHPERFYLDFSIRPETVPQLSYRDVLTGTFDRKVVDGKIVIVGATALELGDHVAVPVHAALPGPVLQAVAYESLRNGPLLERASTAGTLAGIVILALVTGPLFVRRNWKRGTVLAVVLLLACFLVSLASQAVTGVMLDSATWGVTIASALFLGLAMRIDQQDVRLVLQGAAIRRTEILMQRVVENSFDAIVILDDDGRIRSFNRAASEMFGYTERQAVRLPCSALLQMDGAGTGEQRDGDPGIPEDGIQECWGVHRDGSRFPVEVGSSHVIGEDTDGRVLLVRNISARKSQERTLRHQATHDALTGLPNRVFLAERMEAVVEAARREERTAAFLLLDLDRFKEINDTLGHHAGDLLLQRIAERLRGALEPSETIARLGGDEFAILIPDAGLDKAFRTAKGLDAVLSEPFELRELSLRVEASVGIAMYPEHGTDPAELIQRADVAMYVAKRAGCGRAAYRAEDDYNSVRHLTLNGELRRAIEQDHLILHYQPKLSCATGRIVACEALIRWQHPEHGLLPPDEFIGLAEHSGLIRGLTRRVLEHAVAECVRWHEAGWPLAVAVNLSARNLMEAELPRSVGDLLQRSGLPPACLQLEITEGLLMDDPERALEIIGRLHSLGVGICIDDFGTGYSSLAYLKQLPACEIKIDKSFVRQMDDDPDDAVIVRSTIEMAHALKQTVVAEGVETERTWNVLREYGCDLVQGFYFSPPVPAEQLREMLREKRWEPESSASRAPSALQAVDARRGAPAA